MLPAELMSVDDVARITGLSAYTVRAAIRDGELHATKLRNRLRVHPDDLAAWIDASRVQPPCPLTDDAVVPITSPKRTIAPAGGYRQAARLRKRAA